MPIQRRSVTSLCCENTMRRLVGCAIVLLILVALVYFDGVGSASRNDAPTIITNHSKSRLLRTDGVVVVDATKATLPKEAAATTKATSSFPALSRLFQQMRKSKRHRGDEINDESTKKSEQHSSAAALLRFFATTDDTSLIPSSIDNVARVTCSATDRALVSEAGLNSASYDFAQGAEIVARGVLTTKQQQQQTTTAGSELTTPKLLSKFKLWDLRSRHNDDDDDETSEKTNKNTQKKEKSSDEHTPQQMALAAHNLARIACVSFSERVGAVLDQVELWIAEKCPFFFLFTARALTAQEKARLDEIYKTKTLLSVWPSVSPLSRYRVVKTLPKGGDVNTNGWSRFFSAVQQLGGEENKKNENDDADVLLEPTPNEFDWFLFVGPTTFVTMENLQRYLTSREMLRLSSALQLPLVVGHRMTAGHNKVPFVSGSAFFVNRYAMRTLASVLAAGMCASADGNGAQDLLLGTCLHNIGLNTFHAADEHGEDLITIFHPGHWADIVRNPSSLPWYTQYRVPRPMPKGLGALSAFTIASMYLNAEDGRHGYNIFYKR